MQCVADGVTLIGMIWLVHSRKLLSFGLPGGAATTQDARKSRRYVAPFGAQLCDALCFGETIRRVLLDGGQEEGRRRRARVS